LTVATGRIVTRTRLGLGLTSRLLAVRSGVAVPERSRPYREPPEANSFVFADNDRPAREFLRALADHPKESRIHGGRRLITESKDDDTRTLAPGGREDVSKIQIECEHNSALCDTFRRDQGIGKTDEAFVAKMDRVTD
jgi:hypothetical protein